MRGVQKRMSWALQVPVSFSQHRKRAVDRVIGDRGSLRWRYGLASLCGLFMDIGVICPLVLIRKALCALLSDITDVRVVMDAGTISDAFQWLERLAVDILLIDVANAGTDVEDIRRLTHAFPKMKILFLADTYDDDLQA